MRKLTDKPLHPIEKALILRALQHYIDSLQKINADTLAMKIKPNQGIMSEVRNAGDILDEIKMSMYSNNQTK